MPFNHSIFYFRNRLGPQDQKRNYFMVHFCPLLLFHKSMSGQTVVTAHTPHTNVTQIVIVLDCLDAVDGTKKMNFSHDWHRKSKFYWIGGWITRSDDSRCHVRDTLGGTMTGRARIWWKEVNPLCWWSNTCWVRQSIALDGRLSRE